MIPWWTLLLAVAVVAPASWLVTLRSVPAMIARMGQEQRGALLDRVEAIERAAD